MSVSLAKSSVSDLTVSVESRLPSVFTVVHQDDHDAALADLAWIVAQRVECRDGHALPAKVEFVPNGPGSEDGLEITIPGLPPIVIRIFL